MVIIKSKDIAGVYYLKRNIAQDKKGQNYLNYSWHTLLSGNILDVFERIFRKQIEAANEFHGLFYYPNQSFLFRGLRGSARLYAVDLRSDSRNYLKSINPILKADGEVQPYLPKGFAWGILSMEDDTVIQIHTTGEGDTVPFIIYPFDDKLNLRWEDEEIFIPDYELPSVSVDRLREEYGEDGV